MIQELSKDQKNVHFTVCLGMVCLAGSLWVDGRETLRVESTVKWCKMGNISKFAKRPLWINIYVYIYISKKQIYIYISYIQEIFVAGVTCPVLLALVNFVNSIRSLWLAYSGRCPVARQIISSGKLSHFPTIGSFPFQDLATEAGNGWCFIFNL